MVSKDASKKTAKTNDTTKWNRLALARKKTLTLQFATDLDSLARVFASHENCEAIVVRHVDHAFLSLSRLGLTRKKFLLRSDVWSSIGGLLIGTSLAIPDWIGLLPDGVKQLLVDNHLPPLMGAVTFVAGVIILSLAWYRAANPSPP